MLVAQSEVDAVSRQLERVLASPLFQRNERMSRFLRFLIKSHIEGNDSQLKESVIAVEVFGRRTDHDPSQDSIVRTEASRLRARLTEFYAGEGKDDAIVIELPKGGYTPAFRHREPPPESASPEVHQRRRWLISATIALALAVVALLSWRILYKPGPITIAVLPLENLNHDPANDYLSDGLTDELIRNLSLIEGLSPRSRSSSFAFKGKPRNLRQMGRELNVDYIVEGSVLRIGQQLRVEAELVRVRDDFSLWSDRYDRTFTDVFAIQDEISLGIVNSLRLKLGRGRRRYETSAAAYDLYLQARAQGIQDGLGGEIQSINRFEQAIAKDPLFAPAYAGLATALVARSGANEKQALDYSAMEAAAQKAIELDPLLAEAHGALGMVYARKAEWDRSEKSFRRALELDPNDSVLYGNFALDLLFPLNRIQEAVDELRIGIKHDPIAARLLYIFANVLIAARRYDEAANVCLRLPAEFPGRDTWLARARLGQGRMKEAIQLLEDEVNGKGRPGGTAPGFLGYAYGRSGRRADAELLATNTSDPFCVALTYAGLGNREKTLDALEQMAALGPARLGRNLNYPELAVVRNDPRQKALRKRVGLPEN